MAPCDKRERIMAAQLRSRVVVASAVRGLAQHVQKLIPFVTVEDIGFNPKSFQEELASGKITPQLKEAEILLCDCDALLTCLQANAVPKLKWAHSTWAGVDYLLRGLNFKKPSLDFLFTRCGEAFGEIMAEYVIGYMIALERNFAAMKESQQQKLWCSEQFRYFRPLYSLSVGILGYGTIGKKVAAACKGLGMTVWAVNRSKSTSSCPTVDHFRSFTELDEVLRNCDYICTILPHTKETIGLLSGDVLKHCTAKKSVVINIGRGSVISEESLVQAIREGWIGGAVLDVFNQEPLPASSQLWSLPNVIITPHVAGPSLPDQVAKSFVGNLQLFLAGQPLNYVLDWERGY